MTREKAQEAFMRNEMVRHGTWANGSYLLRHFDGKYDTYSECFKDEDTTEFIHHLFTPIGSFDNVGYYKGWMSHILPPKKPCANVPICEICGKPGIIQFNHLELCISCMMAKLKQAEALRIKEQGDDIG